MKEQTHNSFYQADIEGAKTAFRHWQSTQNETIDEYLLRKRKIELNCLVNKVIEAELTDKDKEIVNLHWYQGKSINEAAEVLGIDRSNVSRRLDKINNIIYDKLKYAIAYRYGKDYSSSVRMIIKNKDALCLIAEDFDSPAKRIKNLRKSQGFSLEDTKAMTGIGIKRIEAIESGERELSVSDIIRFATAFKTSGDYIIFGKKEGGAANGFIYQ